MEVQEFLGQIFENDALTRGLGDPEARMLIEWLADRAEWLADNAYAEADARVSFALLTRRARAVSRFIHYWCYAANPGAACQLAAAERFYWPLPEGEADPCELMASILRWEREQDWAWNRLRAAA